MTPTANVRDREARHLRLRLITRSGGYAPEPDLIVVGAQSGGAGLSAWLQANAPRWEDNPVGVYRRVPSSAGGSARLAKSATTHHDFIEKFSAEFPTVRVMRSARYVRSSSTIYTAGGLTSGIDLALHIVEGYFGRDVAQKTADYMEYHGSGWQGARRVVTSLC